MLLQLCILLLIIHDLEGHTNDLEGQNCSSIEDRIALSPLILKVKIRSKFESEKKIEATVKILKVLKGQIKGLTFARIQFDRNCITIRRLKLGGRYFIFIRRDLTSIGSPQRATKRVKKLIKKMSCRNCSTYIL